MKKSLILLLFFVSSCMITHTRNAKIDFALETKESLENYLSDNNLEFQRNDLYSLNSIYTFAEFNDQNKLNLPEILFFNKEGKQVKNVFNKKECSNIISDFEQVNNLEIDDSKASFENLLKNNLKPLYFKDIKKDVVSAVIFYGKFVSSHKSINKQSFTWYEEISKYDNVNVLLVSLDVMEEWNLSEETRKSIGIK